MPRNFSVSNVLSPLKWHARKTNLEVEFLFPFRFFKNSKTLPRFSKIAQTSDEAYPISKDRDDNYRATVLSTNVADIPVFD